MEKQREIFEKHQVFSPAMIDGIIKKLRSDNDQTLREDLKSGHGEMIDLVRRYFHCG